MEEAARIVLALETPEVAEEVMHFLDRTGGARVVATAVDDAQLAHALRQLEPDAVVAAPALLPARDALNGSALLALDTSQSVGRLRRAIRAGASGFYLWPAEREELAHAACHLRRAAPSEAKVPAPVIAVYGARGGVGTTFVATHLAATYAKQGRQCLLVDLDAQFVDVASAVGIADDEQIRTVADLVSLADEISPRQIVDVAWRHPMGFHVLLAAGSPRIHISGDDWRRVIHVARSTCDVVVLHIPRSLDEVSIAGFAVADRVLIVLGLDVRSFRDTQRAIEASGVEARCSFVVNRAVRSAIVPADVERVFGQRPLVVIPSDRAVPVAQDRGRLLPARGRVGRALDRLARQAIAEEP